MLYYSVLHYTLYYTVLRHAIICHTIIKPLALGHVSTLPCCVDFCVLSVCSCYDVCLFAAMLLRRVHFCALSVLDRLSVVSVLSVFLRLPHPRSVPYLVTLIVSSHLPLRLPCALTRLSLPFRCMFNIVGCTPMTYVYVCTCVLRVYVYTCVRVCVYRCMFPGSFCLSMRRSASA